MDSIKKLIIPTIVSAILATIISTYIGSFLVPLYTNRPVIDYYLDTPQNYSSLGVQSIHFNSQNRGGFDAHVTFFLTFTNGTFSDKTDMPYQKIDDSKVEFYYILHSHMENPTKRQVFFMINNGTPGFSIDLTIECGDHFNEKIAYYATTLSYNKTSNNLYELFEEGDDNPPAPPAFDYTYILIGIIISAIVSCGYILIRRKE